MLAALLMLLCAMQSSMAQNSTQPEFLAGTAHCTITPKTPFWLSGYASRNTPAQSVKTDLYAKALALQDPKGKRWILITTDLIGLPRTISDEVLRRLHSSCGLQPDEITLNSSHTHAGPAVWPNLQVLFDLNEADQQKTLAYASQLTDQLETIAKQALQNLIPARLAVGHGSASFAINRRLYSPEGVRIGNNPHGPVDHDVPVIHITRRDNSTLAIVTGYACHNTTLGGAFFEVDGDYAGAAQRALERDHPGATAMFVMLCGGDQNPHPRGSWELAQEYGEALAKTTTRVLHSPMKPVSPEIRTAKQEASLDFMPHTRAQFEKELQEGDVFRQRRARLMLKAYDEGNPVRSISLPIQATQLGSELTFLALGGEVVVGYSLRVKSEHPQHNFMIAGYCHDVACYIPTEKVLQEGGYEADSSMIYYGQPGPFTSTVEDRIFQSINAVLHRVGVD
jgi:hypothetical protein